MTGRVQEADKPREKLAVKTGGKESALPGPLGALGIDARAPKWRPSSFPLWKGPHRRRKGRLCKSPVEMEFSSLHALGEMPRSACHC